MNIYCNIQDIKSVHYNGSLRCYVYRRCPIKITVVCFNETIYLYIMIRLQVILSVNYCVKVLNYYYTLKKVKHTLTMLLIRGEKTFMIVSF